MTEKPGLDFSFSGLKTAAKTVIEANQPLSEQTTFDIAASFEIAVADTLSIKCQRALNACKTSTVILAGGVAANQTLRNEMTRIDADVRYPPANLCTDNGVMIAFAGHERLAAGFREPLVIHSQARWELESLPSLTN